MKIKKIDPLGIVFDNGNVLIYEHYQDCCEEVYADWEYLKDECGIYDADFTDIDIEPVEHKGIRICGKHRSFFVPCYNIQNGYYSDKLDIRLMGDNWKILKEWESVPTKYQNSEYDEEDEEEEDNDYDYEHELFLHGRAWDI